MRRLLAVLVLLAASCDGSGAAVPETSPTISGAASPSTTSAAPSRLTTTQPEGGLPTTALAPSLGADGNRVAPWTGSFASVPAESFRMLSTAVTRVDLPTDRTLAIGYEDGEVRIVTADSAEMAVRSVPSTTGLVYTNGPSGVDVLPPLPDQAPHGRPGVLSTGQVAYVTTDGEVVVWDGAEVRRAAVDALADGDVLVDERDRLLVLTGQTERYPHGILGDPVEATGFVILEPPDLAVIGRGAVEPTAVIEGRRAMWTDMDGDGAREILVTVSTPGSGAGLVVWTPDGELLAEGHPIGQSNRWRHQIAFGRFAAVPAMVEVITPHIGGIVTFRRFDDQLTAVANASPFTSHRIGSRELDMAVAIDMDDDGLLELVLPTQDRRRLVAIGLAAGEAEVEWSAELPSPISSNVAAGLRAGVPTIAVGTEDGDVLTWQPARLSRRQPENRLASTRA